ncbi:MAG TPA: hypothetical protein ENN17_04905 [bacterium]|nr:hypothetical protein [bacterium]
MNGIKTPLTFGMLAVLFFSCSDPLSDRDKRTLVRTLIEGSIDPGKYVIFWDGRDKQREWVAPGEYVCKFWTRDYGQQIEMKALAGDPDRPPRLNDSTLVAMPPVPLHFLLEKNRPDPFHVNEGTNIPFDIPYRAAVRLTIHRKE